ncbi:MAG TPA: hypothetical protein VHZ55_12295 [Bryobacteraceae bacterium]|jgi:hypothetical protein|nr:hypothetical protein [Bryobacteraceae bacterium]
MPERLPRVKWPRTFPICALFGIVIALVLTAGTALVQVRLMQPLQRLYIVPFLKASALPFRLSAKLVEVHSPGHGYIIAVDPWIAVYSDRPREARVD